MRLATLENQTAADYRAMIETAATDESTVQPDKLAGLLVLLGKSLADFRADVARRRAELQQAEASRAAAADHKQRAEALEPTIKAADAKAETAEQKLVALRVKLADAGTRRRTADGNKQYAAGIEYDRIGEQIKLLEENRDKAMREARELRLQQERVLNGTDRRPTVESSDDAREPVAAGLSRAREHSIRIASRAEPAEPFIYQWRQRNQEAKAAAPKPAPRRPPESCEVLIAQGLTDSQIATTSDGFYGAAEIEAARAAIDKRKIDAQADLEASVQ